MVFLFFNLDNILPDYNVFVTAVLAVLLRTEELLLVVSWKRKRLTWLFCWAWTAVTGLGPKGFIECTYYLYYRLFLAVIGLLTLILLFGALKSKVLIKLLILLAELSTVYPSCDIVNSLFFNMLLDLGA